jgi:predicted Zn-dependent protease
MMPSQVTGPGRHFGRCSFLATLVLPWAAGAAAALAVAGCAPPTPGGGQGPGHRQQELALSPEEELELGRKAYREILGEIPEARDRRAEERAREVGKRIVRAAEIRPLQQEINLNIQGYKFEWEFRVLQSRSVNAFCLPGGKVAVFTGLFQVLQDSDDELATVVGHEIAHALAHHASERLARAERTRRESGGGLLDALISRKYDREQESEADHIGVFLMTFAGYNPDAAVTFWERMHDAQRGGHIPEIISDHPSDDRRIQQLRQWVPLAKAGKKAYDEGRITPPRR